MSVFVFIIIIVALVTFGEVAQKWFAARPSPTPVEPGRDDEVERLREHVALLANQVDRLTDEQRFMTRLLEGGGLEGRRASGTPSDESRPEGRPDSRLRGPN
ncbi:MAG: hypothetical protein F4164_04610 [Gemmatimonadales bacterium]|nr:hypothetical protein [Gemmatimonadales bacterium]MYG48652.1 hypothetical protein [Gemmatimonadales bacterium]MYK01110.1 hypothetical protein [Candidatus Palauibacter ramosifaciens]